MTTDEAISKVVSLAYDQVGYKEGNNNYNKYADSLDIQKLYGWGVQNQPWCAVFVNWLFLTAFGYADGSAMTFGGSPACSIAAQNYKNNNAWSMNPRKGDQIFFNISGGINHTGIVADVSGATVTTVEGNYSDGVATNTYYINDPIIAGYGRPKWSVVADEKEPDAGDEDSEIIHPMHRRTYFHLEYGDGIWNPKPQVKAWQNLLLCWGYDLGKYGADGEFGTLTMLATQKWQEKAKGIGADVEVNGIVDEDDWKEIIRIEV